MAVRRAAAAALLCAAGARGLKIDGDAGAAWPGHRAPAAKNVTIILNGEPKSGTTWLEMMVRETLSVLCDDSRNCTYSQRGRTSFIHDTEGDKQFGVTRKHIIPGVAEKMSLQFSLPPKFTDEEISRKVKRELGLEAHVRWVAIFRDPRDVTISACYHQALNCPHAETYLKTHLPSVIKWTALRYRFFREVRRQDRERVLILFYEDLKADQLKQIKRLGSFLLGQTRAGDDEATKVMKRSSFSVMKANGTSIPQGGAQSGKVRRGEACGFRYDLSEEVAEEATETMYALLKNSSLRHRWQCGPASALHAAPTLHPDADEEAEED